MFILIRGLRVYIPDRSMEAMLQCYEFDKQQRGTQPRRESKTAWLLRVTEMISARQAGYDAKEDRQPDPDKPTRYKRALRSVLGRRRSKPATDLQGQGNLPGLS